MMTMWVGELLMVECGLPKGNSPKIYTGREGGGEDKGWAGSCSIIFFFGPFFFQDDIEIVRCSSPPPFQPKRAPKPQEIRLFQLKFPW